MSEQGSSRYSMLERILSIIRQRVRESALELWGITPGDVVVNVPPQLSFGDLALPVAFDLAKRLSAERHEKRTPRQLAEALAERLRDIEGVARVEVAGGGYINLFLKRAQFLRHLMTAGEEVTQSPEKIIVEHTSINPNKAAHIGHLRNAVLGDTLVRLLRSIGRRVEVHNYIDNTGVQVADIVVGFLYLERKTREEIEQIPVKFDHYCWDLYAQVTAWYEREPQALELRRRTLAEIEAGNNPTAELAEYLSMRVLNCQLDTLDRLNIRYDLLPREGEILHLKFWDRAFEMLKSAGLVVYETTGKNKGCWVMRGQRPTGDETTAEEEAAKILVRSDGTVLYTAKDIAYHLWKLGRLGVDFNYRPFRTYQDGHVTWITTREGEETQRHTRPMFGHGTAYLSVIGSEQSYLQAFVKQAIQALVPDDDQVRQSAHIGYEKVSLTPQACLELGIELSPEEQTRRQISMSGRRGLGVKADDLIDKLEEKAIAEVHQRHPELDTEACRAIGQSIARAALRYFLVKYSRTTPIAFDFAEALAFEGETGPYAQYAVVRANSIFQKLRDAGMTPQGLEALEEGNLEQMLTGTEGDDLWSLIYLAGRLSEVVRQACASYEPALVAKYVFQLAQRFNAFYHTYHILSESESARRELYIAIADLVRRQLQRALNLLGIEVPDLM
ncbi:MAG TPA: arginine--tRNA ligase [Blastocatellia bacterium]|nr:arginine--tRNA ligase [Blastocatellia bacterium]